MYLKRRITHLLLSDSVGSCVSAERQEWHEVRSWTIKRQEMSNPIVSPLAREWNWFLFADKRSFVLTRLRQFNFLTVSHRTTSDAEYRDYGVCARKWWRERRDAGLYTCMCVYVCVRVGAPMKHVWRSPFFLTLHEPRHPFSRSRSGWGVATRVYA